MLCFLNFRDNQKANKTTIEVHELTIQPKYMEPHRIASVQ